ncbi:MAG: hypothetical protein ACRDND_00660 [Streptosporangiaceae bacterium]
MITTEERLRAAARAAAATVPPGSAPPLRLPPDAEGRLSPRAWFLDRRLRRRRIAALTPLAAAAAVIIVLAVAVAVAVTHGQPGHRAAARPGQHESLLAQLPPYYVALKGTGQLGDATHAQVRATATGKVVATVRPPRPYTVFSQVSAAGDGREFVFLASRWRSKKLKGVQDWFTSANKFFLLRFDPYTHVPLLSALPIPPDVFRTETGFALSQDGQKLAVARQLSRRTRTGAEIQVFNLVTGAVKTWTWPGGWPVAIGVPGIGQALSWAEDGTLAFQQRTGFSAQVRLLDTNGPGGSLQADSRLVLDWTGNAGSLQYRRNDLISFNAVLTPSGSRIVCATAAITRHPLTSVMSFTEYSARTGRVVRQLGTWTLHGLWPEGNQDVLWTNASGSTLIVVARQPGLKHVTVSGGGDTALWRPVISVLTPGKFVPVPGAPSTQSPRRWPAW